MLSELEKISDSDSSGGGSSSGITGVHAIGTSCNSQTMLCAALYWNGSTLSELTENSFSNGISVTDVIKSSNNIYLFGSGRDSTNISTAGYFLNNTWNAYGVLNSTDMHMLFDLAL